MPSKTSFFLEIFGLSFATGVSIAAGQPFLAFGLGVASVGVLLRYAP